MGRKVIDDALGYVGLRRRGGAEGVASFFAGAGVGAFIGAGIALLVTPYSGPESRRRLARVGEEVTGKVKQFTEGAQAPGSAAGGGREVPARSTVSEPGHGM